MKPSKSWPLIAGIVILVPTLAAPVARGDSVLWYSGNFNSPNGDALTNQVNAAGDGNPVIANGYEAFVVPVGSTWTLSGVYSNDQIVSGTGAITGASVEIRTGVTSGFGGTLIDSLTGTATETPTGANLGFEGNFAAEQTIAVSGLNIVLGAGTYYLAVTPIGPSGAGIFSSLSETIGTGAIGSMPDTSDSYYSYSINGTVVNYFTSTTDPSLEGVPTDFSMGVIGNSAPASIAVPLPPSLMMTLLGGLSAAIGLIRFSPRRGARLV